MDRFDWGNVAERVFWTFVQGALAVPLLDVMNVINDVDAAKAMLAGGLAAVLSLLKNVAAEALQGTPAVPPQAHEDYFLKVDRNRDGVL